MAKKTSNPADAFRKAQRARELKKNKEERKKVRETQTVKKDTRDIEFEIKGLKGKTDASSKSRLAELESELSYINKTKEKYVSEHPEARDRVFRTHTGPRGDGEGEGGGGPSRSRLGPNGEDLSHLYDEEGRLRDPKKSVYYDAVYNPFGVPPPGMPYRERTPDEESDEEDGDEDEDSDDDIVMPDGPPPDQDGLDTSDSDDSDDIPLPEGPPPPRSLPQPPLPLPQMPHGGLPGQGHGFPGQPFGFRPIPPRPYFPPAGPGAVLPVRPGYIQPFDQVYGTGPAGPSTYRPRPPRQNAPHNRPPAAVQDPLSDAPTQTYQGYRMHKHDLPARPSAPGASESENSARAEKEKADVVPPKAATISAEPVLRDLRKEATAFVPRGLKKKQAPGGIRVGAINSAPGAGEIDEDGDERKSVRPSVGAGGAAGGLMGKLQGVLGAPSAFDSNADEKKKKSKGDDDYQNFLEGLGDIA